MNVKVREIWRKVPGLPPRIEVSNLGRVRTQAFTDARGHRRRAKFRSNRTAKYATWILRAFVGPRPGPGYVARHLDDDRTNNKLSNLAWGTWHDNYNDSLRNGRVHVISGDHRVALLSGYRKKFPEKKKVRPKRCKCGCGQSARPGSRFIHGHFGRLSFQRIAAERAGRPRAW